MHRHHHTGTTDHQKQFVEKQCFCPREVPYGGNFGTLLRLPVAPDPVTAGTEAGAAEYSALDDVHRSPVTSCARPCHSTGAEAGAAEYSALDDVNRSVVTSCARPCHSTGPEAGAAEYSDIGLTICHHRCRLITFHPQSQHQHCSFVDVEACSHLPLPLQLPDEAQLARQDEQQMQEQGPTAAGVGGAVVVSERPSPSRP